MLYSESVLRSSMSPKPGIQCVLYTIGFLIKYTTRCAIIVSYTVQYVRNKIGDLKPKADILTYFQAATILGKPIKVSSPKKTNHAVF